MESIQIFKNDIRSLTKVSTSDEIKAYFQKVLELKQSGEEFPVNFDEVWQLVYEHRHKASAAIKENFIEGVDFYLTQMGKVVKSTNLQNGVKAEAKLSVSCMEYFIARKVRFVFEVYRQVFHKVAEQSRFQVPQTFAEALRLAAEQTEKLEAANKQIESQRPAVVFHDSVTASNTVITVADMAKLICQNVVEMGEHRLYKWFVDNKYLICRQRWSKSRNRYENDYMPYQRFVEMGLFFVAENVIQGANEPFVKHTVKIAGRGQSYFINKFLNAA